MTTTWVRSRGLLVFLSAALAWWSWAPPAWAGLDEGRDALALKDFRRARAEFEALPNDPEAIYHLARMAGLGYGEPINPVRRFGLLERAAALGHTRSKLEMAWLMGSGNGTTAGPQAAIRLLEQLDAGGDVDATVLLGRVYHFAWWNVAQDWPRATALFKKATEAGNDAGATDYANALILGQGVPADPSAGFELLQNVAEKGVPDAQLALARVLSEGTGGLARDLARAYALHRDLARQGDAYAQFMTCTALMEGRGVARDLHAAARWCDGAARQGYDWAQLRLAEMFRLGQGMPRLAGQAYYWYSVAASGTGSAAGRARERRAHLAPEFSQEEIEYQNKRAAAFRPEPGLRVREAPPTVLARGAAVKLGEVSIAIAAPPGYFNNWEFLQRAQSLLPNAPMAAKNLMMLSHREDFDRYKMGLPSELRSVEVSSFADDDVTVTAGMFLDIRKSVTAAADKARGTGRFKIETARDDDSALLLVREQVDEGNNVDAKAWILLNSRVLILSFTGFTHEQLKDLRQFAPAVVRSIVAQNTSKLPNLFGSAPN